MVLAFVRSLSCYVQKAISFYLNKLKVVDVGSPSTIYQYLNRSPRLGVPRYKLKSMCLINPDFQITLLSHP